MPIASRGMTTYDYVVEKHRQARLELNAKAKRTSVVASANDVSKMEMTINDAATPTQDPA